MSALLATRARLLSLEALDARDRFLGRLALLLAAGVFFLLAMLVASAAFALYFWPGEHRFLALGMLALLYLLVGVALLAAYCWRRRHDPVPFSVLADVLAQDAELMGAGRPVPRQQGDTGQPEQESEAPLQQKPAAIP